MRETQRELLKTTVTSLIGGAAGAGAYGIIGGVGITVAGTAVGVTLGPFIGIGAGLGAAFYGVYSWGRNRTKQNLKKQPF